MKSYMQIFFAYKTSYGANHLHIVFNKGGGYIRKYDSNKCLALFYCNKKYEKIFDRISYLIML